MLTNVTQPFTQNSIFAFTVTYKIETTTAYSPEGVLFYLQWDILITYVLMEI